MASLLGEGQIDPRHEGARGVANGELRNGMQSGQRKDHAQSRLGLRFGARIGELRRFPNPARSRAGAPLGLRTQLAESDDRSGEQQVESRNRVEQRLPPSEVECGP
jgi:hypothetical protein